MTQDISGTNNEDAESLLDDIGDYMNDPVLSISHDSTVQEAAQYIRVSNVGSLLIKGYDD